MNSRFRVQARMRCVHCGKAVAGVFIQYSPGNIRLANCPECGCVADEYVECETIIIVIDLILHKPQVYRHLFFNTQALSSRNMKTVWNAVLVFLLLDSCIIFAEVVRGDSVAAFSYAFGKIFVKAALIYIQHITTIWLILQYITKRRASRGMLIDILVGVTVSNYFKLLILAMMVWNFSPFMALILEMLVLSSNVVALRVILDTTTAVSAIAAATSAAMNVVLARGSLW